MNAQIFQKLALRTMASEQVGFASSALDMDEKKFSCSIFVSELPRVSSDVEVDFNNLSEVNEQKFLSTDGVKNEKFSDAINKVILMNEIEEDNDSHLPSEVPHASEIQDIARMFYREIHANVSEGCKDDCSSGVEVLQVSEKKVTCKESEDFLTLSHLTRPLPDKKGEKPNKCEICGKGFSRRSHLKEHMTAHTRDKPFKCNVCHKGYSRKSNLNVHKAIHTGARPYICDVCGKGFGRKNILKTHMIVHSGEERYNCRMCGIKFSQRSKLAEHIATHRAQSHLECTLCGKKHAFRSSMIKHMKNHHQIYTVDGKSNATGTSLSEGDLDPLALRSSDIKMKAARERRKLESNGRRFRCSECGKEYSRNFTLTVHMAVHSGIKAFKCDICGKGFARKSVLKNHMIVHSGERKYKCNLCDKEFSQQAGLTEHLVKHTTESNYECSVCGKKAAFKSSFVKHMRSHLKEGGNESAMSFQMVVDSLNLDEAKIELMQGDSNTRLEPSSSSHESFNIVKEEPIVGLPHGIVCGENRTNCEEEELEEEHFHSSSSLDGNPEEVGETGFLSFQQSDRIVKEEYFADNIYSKHFVSIKEEASVDCERESDI